MKKIIAMILLVALMLGICACTTQGGQDATGDAVISDEYAGQFRVGYSRVNITPQEDVNMGGYGNTDRRLSNSVLSYMYLTCVAITDENDETLLLMPVDTGGVYDVWSVPGRELIAKATGVPYDNIIIGATHQHCSPDTSYTANPANERWVEQMILWVRDAAVAAMADRKPATIEATSTYTEGLNFVRHYILGDGTVAGDNHNHLLERGDLQHVKDADSELQMVRFVREEDKDVWLVNWQAHLHRAGGSKKYYLTADVTGEFRDALEAQEEDCLFAYLNGAGGNINTTSWISELNITKDYKETGQALAATALAAKDSFTPVETGLVSTKKLTFTANVNHSEDYMLEDAKTIQQMWTQTRDAIPTINAAMELGMYSPFHANSIISRANMGETYDLTISAATIGSIGFVSAPYEMFDTSGEYIKENSPYDMTFVVAYSNGHIGYIASEEAYDYGCYEVDNGKFEKGTAENLAETYVTMLNELHAGQ